MSTTIISHFGLGRHHHRFRHANAHVRWKPDRLWWVMCSTAMFLIALAMLCLRLTWW